MATIIRRGDSDDLAGFVSEISPIRHQVSQVVTAVRTQANTLKLISWRLKNDGSFERTSPSNAPEAGAASSIDIAGGGNKYVTACRAGNGRLTLNSWNVTNEGVITRLRDSGTLAGEATTIKIVAIGSIFITACRAGNGRLKLISWRLNADNSFSRVGESEAAETVSEISLTLLPLQAGGFRHLVTAVRGGDGSLKLFVWRVTDAGAISPLGNSGTKAGAATMIRAVRESAQGRVITACRAGNGALKLISWAISGDGNTIDRLGDSHTLAGEIGDNSLLSRASNGILISAVRTAAGTLKLIGWRVDAAGRFTRTGDSEGQPTGAASLITICQVGFEPATIVTGVRAGNNNLKLISWREA